MHRPLSTLALMLLAALALTACASPNALPENFDSSFAY